MLVNPYKSLQQAGRSELAALAWQALKDSSHGDLKHWLTSIQALPDTTSRSKLNCAAPILGRPVEDQALLRKL